MYFRGVFLEVFQYIQKCNLLHYSELAFYLPTSTRSMNYALELEGETATTTDSTLPLFGTAESSDGTAMFFTGGPVWAMDWLCMRDGQGTPTNGEQHLVLTAYRDYDEVSKKKLKLILHVTTCIVENFQCVTILLQIAQINES